MGRVRHCQRCRGPMALTALVDTVKNRASPGRRDRFEVAIDVCAGAGHRQGCLWPGGGVIIINCSQRRSVDIGRNLDQSGEVGRAVPVTAGMAFHTRCRRGTCSSMAAMFAYKTACGRVTKGVVNRTDISGI